MTQMFDPKRVKALSDHYEFYQYLDDQKRPLLGQYFAVNKFSANPSTNSTFVYQAVVKKFDRPNTEVVEGLLNSTFIDRNPKVAVAAVAKNHPRLIEFLLSRSDSKRGKT